jgi:MFS family permease
MVDVSRARWAITGVFGGNGLLIASLAVRTPSLKLDLGLTTGQLGLLSALFGISAVVAMQTTGRLVFRFGSGLVVRAVTLVLPVALVLVGAAPGLLSLAAAQLAFGALHGTLDVAMNAHAVTVERAMRRPILNGCHAAWSIGAVTGSLLGSAAVQLGLSRSQHYLVLAVLVIPSAWLAGRFLLPSAELQVAQRPQFWRGWTPRVVLFGAMGATVLTAEAAVANWSGIFLHDHTGATLGAAALGYVAFTAAQTAGRLVGDRLLARGAADRLLRIGVLVGAFGFGLVLLSPTPSVGVVGFAVVGIGMATPLPVLFGLVGRLGAGDSSSAEVVARFTTMTYSGILLAPAIIGAVAEVIGLTWTLAMLIPLLMLVAAAVSRATRPAPASVELVHSGI